MPINWSVDLLIVHMKQHGCKHHDLGEACCGLGSVCSQITTPARPSCLAWAWRGSLGHLGAWETRPEQPSLPGVLFTICGQIKVSESVGLTQRTFMGGRETRVTPQLEAAVFAQRPTNLNFSEVSHTLFSNTISKMLKVSIFLQLMGFPFLYLAQRSYSNWLVIPDPSDEFSQVQGKTGGGYKSWGFTQRFTR